MKINENNKCDCKCIHQDRTELAIETLNEIKIYKIGAILKIRTFSKNIYTT